MSNIVRSEDELIGKTPLLELANIEKKLGLSARILAKLEFFNPAGSVKDRVAKKMIDDAEAAGILKPGSAIIEPTSGNTGIGIAAVAAARGYRTIIVMPDNMSRERRLLIAAYGAELVLTPAAEGMKGSIAKAEELAASIPDSFIPDQFGNPSNPAAHFETTGPEIYDDTDGKVDAFICGIGTGGTVSGTGNYLKSKLENIEIIGVEPANSPFLTEGRAGVHGLQGIGAGFVPAALDTTVYNSVVTVTEEEAYTAARMLARSEGVLVGISSGAALHAAIEFAKKKENIGKTVVVLLPDSGDKYLSTPLFED